MRQRCRCATKDYQPCKWEPGPDDEQRRWDIAIDIVLNSGLFAPYVDDFWRFVDGEDPEGEFRRSIT